MSETISEDTFYEVYQPIAAADGGDYWERDAILAAGIPTARVWSVMDGDEGSIGASPGWHVVNVFAYMVTEVPWTDGGICAILQDRDEGFDDEPTEDDLNREGDPNFNGAW